MKKFIEVLSENKGVLAVIGSVITVGFSLYLAIRSENHEKAQEAAKQAAQVKYNTMRLNFYDDYAAKSTESREAVVKMMGEMHGKQGAMEEDIEEIKADLKYLIRAKSNEGYNFNNSTTAYVIKEGTNAD